MKDTEGEAVDPGFLGLDIGPKSIAKFDEALTGAKTVVWNGHKTEEAINTIDEKLTRYLISLSGEALSQKRVKS